MDLTFQTNGGKPFTIEIGYFDTVLEIKHKLQKHKGIPACQQTLIFNGNILPDDLNVHNSDILDRSQIRLILASDAENQPINTDHDSNHSPRMRLLLKMPASKLLAVDVSIKDTIKLLKERIHEVEGIPISRMMIHANGNELADHRTVVECELSENSDVTVSIRSVSTVSRPSAMKLRVVVQYRTERIQVEVSAEENVGELRRKLQKMKWNLPEDGSFFIYKQNVMDDNRPLRWYEVGQGDTIEIFSGSVSYGS